MNKNLTRVRDTWDKLGTIDPMWAIHTDPEKFGRKWLEAEFFEAGAVEIAGIMDEVRVLGSTSGMQRSLDFGCGIGRLSRAMCKYYEHVDGVDVAPSMIELADRYNLYPERCTFTLNQTVDLRIFSDETFDLVYSNIVLQHMAPKLALEYIREFARCTKTGGIIIFQIPDARRFNATSIRNFLRHCIYAVLPLRFIIEYRRKKYQDVPTDVIERLPKIAMEMHCLPRRRIVMALQASCRLLRISDTSGKDDAFVSNMYFFRKS